MAQIKIFKDDLKAIEEIFDRIETTLKPDYIVTRTSEFINNNLSGDCHVYVYVEKRKEVEE